MESSFNFSRNQAVKSILTAAWRGPFLPADRPPNLADWVGVGTLAWQVVMFFKHNPQEGLWFCHVDIAWQQTFLLMVACELLHTTEQDIL